MCSIGIHSFSGQILDKSVSFQVYRMKDSLVLWIGTESQPSLKEMAVAMTTPYSKEPTAVKLMGDTSSLTSPSLAARLSKRCKKQVFVSCNLPDADYRFLNEVEQRLVEEITTNSDAF